MAVVLLYEDYKRLPWEKSHENISRLFIQCKKKEVPVFISSIGVGVVGYYCATGYTLLNVINGNERGTNLSYIHSFNPEQTKKLRDNDVFLDRTTGDYYTYESVFLYLIF